MNLGEMWKCDTNSERVAAQQHTTHFHWCHRRNTKWWLNKLKCSRCWIQFEMRYFSFSFIWKIFHILVNYPWHFKWFLWNRLAPAAVDIGKCEAAIPFMKSSTLMGFCQTQTWNGTSIASTQIFINAKPGVKRTGLTETEKKEKERARARERHTMSARWSIDFVQIKREENTPFLLLNIKWGIKRLRRAALNDRSNKLNGIHVRMYLEFVLCYFYNNFCRDTHGVRKKNLYVFYISSCVILCVFSTFSGYCACVHWPGFEL